MKKVVKVLSLVVLTMMLWTVVVKASGCDDITIYYDSGRDGSSSFGGAAIPEFEFSGSSGVKFTGYCHDPGITPKKGSSSSSSEVQCGRVILDPTSKDSTSNAFDAGLISILTSNADYGTKYKAMMVYQMFWTLKDTTRENFESYTNEFRYWANKYMSDDNEIKDLLSSLRKKFGNLVIRSKTYEETKEPSTGYNMDASRNLVVSALKEALNYTKAATVTAPNPSKVRSESNENGEKVYKQTITYKINIDNFNSDSAKVRLEFSCPECANYHASSKFYLNGKEVTLSDLANINLASKDYIVGGTGVVEFKIEFSANAKDYLCEDIDYTLKVLYYDESISVVAYDVSEMPNHNTDVQSFYIVAESNNERTLTLKDTVSMCTANCKDVQEMCNNGDSRACDIFKEKYHNECVFCSTSLPTVECKTCEVGEQGFDIVEGYNVDATTCKTPTKEDLNIRACIANDEAIDSAGNSYKENDLSRVSSYVNVYCKEDFHFNMPGTISVNSGSYFVLRADIDGTKQCYTNQITDAGLDGKVVEAAKESVENYEKYKNILNQIDAYNKGLQSDKKAVGYHVEVDKTTEGCEDKKIMAGCTDGGPSDNTGACWDANKQAYSNQKVYNYRGKVVLVSDLTECTWGSPGSCKTTPAGATEDLVVGEWVGCGKYSSAYDDGTISADTLGDEYINNLTNQLGSIEIHTGTRDPGLAQKCPSCGGTYTYTTATGATGEVAVGTGPIYDYVTEFNSASGYVGGTFSGHGLGSLINPRPFEDGWKMAYQFAPEMYFWYQEDYMKDVLTDQLTFREPLDIETDPHLKLCVGDVTDDYENCNGSEANWKTEHKEGDTYTTKNIWACDLDGCRWFSYIQSKVTYSKASLEAKAKFVTPTQFYAIYPTPGIVTAKQGVDVTNGSPLENGLPVSLNATNGAKSYLLWVKDLGEYYDHYELGRIWGNEKSVLPTALKESSACLTENSALQYEKNVGTYYHGDGIYSCEYDVNVCDASCKAPIIDESGRYTYTNDNGVFKSKVDKATYEADCCPNGKCPTEVVNKCAIGKDEAGNLVYYDDKGNVVNKEVYEAKCCRNGNCPVECKNCLYNGKDLMVDYHQVTNENINPTDREMGQNWNWDDNIDSALELKAYVTTKEIEEAGNSVFDIDFDNPKEDGDFAMQVKMDGQLISKIRTWNKKPENENYLSNTLECYDLEDSSTDRVYKNVYCYSTFIDYLLSEEDSAKKIKFAGVGLNRPTSKSERKANSSSYFTNWISVNASDWGITDKIALDYTSHFGKEYNLETGVQIDYHVGPSWK